jgi:hypothetical protein
VDLERLAGRFNLKIAIASLPKVAVCRPGSGAGPEFIGRANRNPTSTRTAALDAYQDPSVCAAIRFAHNLLWGEPVKKGKRQQGNHF